jgi:hypothetical protein
MLRYERERQCECGGGLRRQYHGEFHWDHDRWDDCVHDDVVDRVDNGNREWDEHGRDDRG